MTNYNMRSKELMESRKITSDLKGRTEKLSYELERPNANKAIAVINKIDNDEIERLQRSTNESDLLDMLDEF